MVVSLARTDQVETGSTVAMYLQNLHANDILSVQNALQRKFLTHYVEICSAQCINSIPGVSSSRPCDASAKPVPMSLPHRLTVCLARSSCLFRYQLHVPWEEFTRVHAHTSPSLFVICMTGQAHTLQ